MISVATILWSTLTCVLQYIIFGVIFFDIILKFAFIQYVIYFIITMIYFTNDLFLLRNVLNIFIERSR